MSSRDDKTIRELFLDIEDNICVLPDFQRDFVWDDGRQKKLLASTLVNLSIGALLFIEGSKKDFSIRHIGYAKNNIDNRQETDSRCLFLLDGQQRLTCLWSFFSDIFADINDKNNPYKNWRSIYDNLYSGLRKRWVISLKQINEESTIDLFGYNNLSFETEISSLEPDDVIDYILPKKIVVGNYKNWYHPGYFCHINKDNAQTLGKIKQNIADEAAKECVVPLYSLFHDSLYIDIINKIAKGRGREIEDILDNITELDELRQKCIELFSKQDPILIESINEIEDIEELRKKAKDDLSDLKSNWASNIKSFFDGIIKNRIYFLRLEKNEIGRAIAIFTAINEGGQKLSTFDLIVAKAAKDPLKYNESFIQRIRNSVNQHINITKSSLDGAGVTDWVFNWMGCIDDKNSISSKFKDNFLNILSGFVHGGYLTDKKNFANKLTLECFKAGMQLKLDSSQISDNYDITIRAISRAYAFLQFRCGVVSINDLSYKLMLLPIAFCLVDDKCWKDKATLDKLEFWYWSSIFSARYRDFQNEKSLEDCKFLFNYLVLGKPLSNEMKDSLISRRDNIFSSTTYCDIKTLTREDKNSKVPSAIHNTILQYILSNTPRDFLPKNQYEEYRLCAWEIARCINDDYEIVLTNKNGTKEHKSIKLQDHHIFPLGAAKPLNSSTKDLRKQETHPLNSPLNRTYISSFANGLISSMIPEQYFSYIDDKALSDHLSSKFNSVKRIPNEDENSFYVRILKQRFDILKMKIMTELDNLWKL